MPQGNKPQGNKPQGNKPQGNKPQGSQPQGNKLERRKPPREPSSPAIEFQFPVPNEKRTFRQFLHDKKKGTYLGCTPRRFRLLFIFFSCFYLSVFCFSVVCFQVYALTLYEGEPKWKLDASPIGTQPGFVLKPDIIHERGDPSRLIKFNPNIPAQYKHWTNLLDEFIASYNESDHLNTQRCDFVGQFDPNKACFVDINSFGPCSSQNEYGYNTGRPCVFLKLNKIFDWLPNYFDNISSLPKDMPVDLKTHIASLTPIERRQIWVSCRGQRSNDNMGSIKFYPTRGLPKYYYPYHNQPAYRNPLVAVQFESLPVNKFVKIECRAWAKNIKYKGGTLRRAGSVAIEFIIG